MTGQDSGGNRVARAEAGPLCECCAKAAATEWHPDLDGDVYGYCAPCVAALAAYPPDRAELAEWERHRALGAGSG